MGFGVSNQHVGINRVGVYLQPCRTKGNPTSGTSPFHGEEGTAAQKPNEPWRRISDLVGANAETRDPKIRTRCVRKLVAWIERRWCEAQAKVESREIKQAAMTEGWDWNFREWRRVARGGRSVESVCLQLGIAPAKLTGLLKETHGISASELLDGFKIRNLKKFLVAQLRLAAERLWDSPGEFAKRRCMRVPDSGMAGRGALWDARSPYSRGAANGGRFAHGAGGTPAVHKRRYFRTRAEEFLGLEHGEDERLRLNELLGMLDRVRDENDFEIEALAAVLGFESAWKFKRACLNVMGRTLAQLERILAREIVAFYLAAEDRELRAICFREDELGFCAREIYCGDAETIPTEPFLDRWSACEAGKPEWLKKMKEAFG